MWKKEQLHRLTLLGAFYLVSFSSPTHPSGVYMSSMHHPVFTKGLSGQWVTETPRSPSSALGEDSGQHLQTCIVVVVGPN